jgi:hypothetical protein
LGLRPRNSQKKGIYNINGIAVAVYFTLLKPQEGVNRDETYIQTIPICRYIDVYECSLVAELLVPGPEDGDVEVHVQKDHLQDLRQGHIKLLLFKHLSLHYKHKAMEILC